MLFSCGMWGHWIGNNNDDINCIISTIDELYDVLNCLVVGNFSGLDGVRRLHFGLAQLPLYAETTLLSYHRTEVLLVMLNIIVTHMSDNSCIYKEKKVKVTLTPTFVRGLGWPTLLFIHLTISRRFTAQHAGCSSWLTVYFCDSLIWVMFLTYLYGTKVEVTSTPHFVKGLGWPTFTGLYFRQLHSKGAAPACWDSIFIAMNLSKNPYTRVES